METRASSLLLITAMTRSMRRAQSRVSSFTVDAAMIGSRVLSATIICLVVQAMIPSTHLLGATIFTATTACVSIFLYAILSSHSWCRLYARSSLVRPIMIHRPATRLRPLATMWSPQRAIISFCPTLALSSNWLAPTVRSTQARLCRSGLIALMKAATTRSRQALAKTGSLRALVAMKCAQVVATMSSSAITVCSTSSRRHIL